MKAIDFYYLTKKHLEDLATLHGVEDLEKYYFLTDFIAYPQLERMNEIEQTFMQLTLHGQNATIISNIVNMKKNYNILREVLCGFNPQEMLKKYNIGTREENIDVLIQAFRDAGLSWRDDKSSKRPNAIMKRYANMLFDAATYLEKFTNKQEVIGDLLSHFENGNTKALITYFRSKITTGYSVALSCDFLKEYAEEFCDLPKPDIHIKDTLCTLNGLELGYYHTEHSEYQCIEELQKLVRDINLELKNRNEKEITVYQLDRMIWLICSNKFFLDGNMNNSKSRYLSAII